MCQKISSKTLWWNILWVKMGSHIRPRAQAAGQRWEDVWSLTVCMPHGCLARETAGPHWGLRVKKLSLRSLQNCQDWFAVPGPAQGSQAFGHCRCWWMPKKSWEWSGDLWADSGLGLKGKGRRRELQLVPAVKREACPGGFLGGDHGWEHREGFCRRLDMQLFRGRPVLLFPTAGPD